MGVILAYSGSIVSHIREVSGRYDGRTKRSLGILPHYQEIDNDEFLCQLCFSIFTHSGVSAHGQEPSICSVGLPTSVSLLCVINASHTLSEIDIYVESKLHRVGDGH